VDDHHDMDPHDIDPRGTDPHGLEPPEPDHGLGSPEPDHGLDGTDPADHEWSDPAHSPAELGHEDDLDSADTAHLGFAEEYDPGDTADGGLSGADHGLHPPVGDGDLPADLPDQDMLGTLDAAEAPFGTDPDLYPLTGADLGDDPAFPPTLELDPPEPIDGYPWADPSALGHDLLPEIDDGTGGTGSAVGPDVAEPFGPDAPDPFGPDPAELFGPDPAELFEYAGELPSAGGAAWSALLASEDPATSALARWWSAG
jgi:hypothetical protein